MDAEERISKILVEQLAKDIDRDIIKELMEIQERISKRASKLNKITKYKSNEQ